MKRILTVLLAAALLLTGCGRQASQEPLAVTAGGKVFYYGDTQERIEKIIDPEGSEANTRLKNQIHYKDGTQILYRESGDKKQAVLMLFKSPGYLTYQGIQVGDAWDDVKDRLDLVAENGKYKSILFDGTQQKDPLETERENGWVMISYMVGDDGRIQYITIGDVLAGTAFM